MKNESYFLPFSFLFSRENAKTEVGVDDEVVANMQFIFYEGDGVKIKKKKQNNNRPFRLKNKRTAKTAILKK